jgi:hypothetical protein
MEVEAIKTCPRPNGSRLFSREEIACSEPTVINPTGMFDVNGDSFIPGFFSVLQVAIKL